MKYLKLFEAKKQDPFIQSAKRGSTTTVKEFIKNGVDVNMKDDEDKTALMHACSNSLLMIVKILIDAGADVNLKDNKERTALMMASTPTIFKILVDAGADVNAQNMAGDTAIMERIYGLYNNPEQFIKILEMFLQKGLDLDITNNQGQNFYALLKDRQYYFSILYKSEYNKVFESIIKYMDEKFPKYKEKCDFDNDVKKYNL